MTDPFIDETAVAAMDRHRRREMLKLSPEQRLEKLQELQAIAWQLLEVNPVAKQAFIARNHHKRNETNVRLLEQKMRGQA